MLSDKMLQILNKQIALEGFSSNLYLSMGSWCDYENYDGSAKFFKKQGHDERTHHDKIYEYVLQCGEQVLIEGYERPKQTWSSLEEIFQAALDHERMITASINELMDACMEEKDYSTFEFLGWYAAEQHEEEEVVLNFLEKIQKFANDNNGLYMVDKEIGCSI